MVRPRAKTLTTKDLLSEVLEIDLQGHSAIHKIKKAGVSKHRRARTLSQVLKPDDILTEALGKSRMINTDGTVVRSAIPDEEFSFLPTYGTPSRAIRGALPIMTKPVVQSSNVPIELRRIRPTGPATPGSIMNFENTIGRLEEVKNIDLLLTLIGLPEPKDQRLLVFAFTNLFKDHPMVGKGPRKLDGVTSRIVAIAKEKITISKDFAEKITLKETDLIKAVQIKWCYYILWCVALVIRDQFIEA